MFKDVPLMHSIALKDLSENKIDATIGVFLDDNKNLVYSDIFDNALSKVNKNMYNYAAVDGGTAYKNAMFSCFNVPSEYSMVSTPGGTGALTILMAHKKAKTNALVIPRLAWSNYNKMAELNGYDIVYSDFITLDFDYDVFNKYDNVMFLVNTPASNPVGISYSKELLTDVLTKVKQYPNAVVVFDLAYYNFEDNQEFIFEFGKQFECYYMLSLSKTLGVYGFRLGALVSSVKENLAPIARGIWSSISNVGILAFVEAAKDIEALQKEINEKKDILQDRTKFFINLLNENSIPYYPFQNGFFVTLDFKEPDELIKYLMEKHIYTVKCNGGIRIAVCSINKREMTEIVKNIKEFIQITCKSN